MLGQSVQQPIYTYVLSSPITGDPIYVGKGIHDRAYKHRFQHSPIGAYVRELVSNGLRPTIERIPAKDADEAFEMEELLVGLIGRLDDGTGTLYNRRPGGRRVYQSEATRRKIGAAHLGKPLSEAHKAAVSRTLTGRKQSDELKQRHSIRMKLWWANRKSNMDSRS